MVAGMGEGADNRTVVGSDWRDGFYEGSCRDKDETCGLLGVVVGRRFVAGGVGFCVNE